MFRKSFLMLAGAVLIAFSLHAQVTIESITPRSGKPGDLVQITLSELDENVAYKTFLGDMEMAVLNIEGNNIISSIPDNAKTDRIRVVFENENIAQWLPFTVTVDTSISLDGGISEHFLQATAASLYGETDLDEISGIVPIPKGEVSFVVVGKEEDDAGLISLTLGSSEPITIGAESSIMALIYMNPLIYDSDPMVAVQILSELQSLPATKAAIEYATTLIHDRIDITEDSAIEELLASAILEYLAQPSGEAAPLAFNPMGPLTISPDWPRSDGFVNAVEPFTSSTPKDLETPGYPLNRLETSALAHSRNKAGLPILGVKFDAARLKSLEDLIRQTIGAKVTIRANSLEWGARLYALDSLADPLSTREKVEDLEGSLSVVYPRITDRPVGSAMVGAKPALGYVDMVGVIKDLLFAKLFPVLNPPTKIDVPAHRSGLYMVRSFSGARFDPQDDLLESLPEGEREHLRMMTINVIMAINEAAGLILKSETIIGDRAFAKLVITLEQSISAALFKEHSNGTLNNRVMGVIFLEGLKTYTKEMFFKFLDKIVEKGLTKVLPTVGSKFVLKSINVFGKIASAGKLVERLPALSNASTLVNSNAYLAQSVQSTLVVVGDPWEPKITSFYPTSAHRGISIKINGTRFSEVPSENIVTFNNLTTRPNNPPAAARAEVLKATRDSLIVKIPEEAGSGFITVTIKDRGSYSTAKLSGRYRSFTVLPDPVITKITPNPPRAGKMMLIEGHHFGPKDTKYLGADSVDVVYNGNAKVEPLSVTHNAIMVRAPNSVSGNSVVIQLNGRTSNKVDFSTELPTEFTEGATIRVTTLEDFNDADGEVSLREAMLLATGNVAALGRPWTIRTDDTVPGQTVEADFITSPELAGAGSIDTILFQLPITPPGEAVSNLLFLNDPLPPMDNHDSYLFPSITIDGHGVYERGLIINGKSGVTIRGGELFTLTGFLKNGIHITGGSSNNTISGIYITGCGGAGVLIQESAMLNTIWDVAVRDCDTGYHLFGHGVMLNTIGLNTSVQTIQIANNSSFGYLIDGGARFNLIHPENVINNDEAGIAIIGTPSIGEIPYLGHGNIIDTGLAFPFPNISGNQGPGVVIQAPSTQVRHLNVFDNDGDGILIEGVESRGSHIYGIRSGYDDENIEAHLPNTGNGIHVTNGARDIHLGQNNVPRQEAIYSFDRNFVGGNGLNGVAVSGKDTQNIFVTMTHSGRVLNKGLDTLHKKPNLRNGIAILEGAKSTTIGGNYRAIDVRVHHHENGAGILISGEGTSKNVVLNCEIGSNPTGEVGLGNKHGVRITDKAHSNVIGLRGAQYQVREDDGLRFFGSSNQIRGNLEAGILLESGIDPFDLILPDDLPSKGNVIQNNFIGLSDNTANEVGIWINGEAYGNRIGGSVKGEGNLISYNRKAGILITSNAHAAFNSLRLPNRIIGNTITRLGNSKDPDINPVPSTDAGIGILLAEGSSGHVIGGESPGEENIIRRNHIGVYINSSNENQLIANELDRNSISGVFMNDAKWNMVGPYNEIIDNGSGNVAQGGIAIHNGGYNNIRGNYIGIKADQDSFADGNTPDGIFVSNSNNNYIGSLGIGGSNIIYGNGRNGITLRGDAAVRNSVANNYIGISSNPGAFIFFSNSGHGVHITEGASKNIIGGEQLVPVRGRMMPIIAGNFIEKNGLAGVKVEGAASTQNTITHNSITNHSGDKGIELADGGNGQLPAPNFSTIDGLNVFGTVDPTKVPDGSLVQFFADPDDEGKSQAGEAIVKNGRFESTLIMPGFVNITATVTHSITGDTSEFSELKFLNLIGLDVRRSDENLTAFVAPANQAVSVLPITLTAIGGDVLVDRIRVFAEGTLNDKEDIVSVAVYRDSNGDKSFSAQDEMIGEAKQFVDDDSLAFLYDLGGVVSLGRPEQWFIVAVLSENASNDGTVTMLIQDAEYIESRGFFPSTPILESGVFPLVSNTLSPGEATVGGGVNDWLALHFSTEERNDPEISGLSADPDLDGITNLMEYAYGLNPNSPFNKCQF
jgi:hypothetical protein